MPGVVPVCKWRRVGAVALVLTALFVAAATVGPAAAAPARPSVAAAPGKPAASTPRPAVKPVPPGYRPPSSSQVSPAQVDLAIRRAVAFLYEQQKPTGQ